MSDLGEVAVLCVDGTQLVAEVNRGGWVAGSTLYGSSRVSLKVG
jgi:hypothetical protein